ncbi:MAG: phosphomannomutase [Rhodocyclaceae bacterium]|nr:phosphomannomutase [Rhodocyclaceae bacterium]
MKPLKDCFPAVAFGTSGVRARVVDLTPQAVAAYATAFARHVRGLLGDKAPRSVVVGIDLRPSSPAIAAVVCHALHEAGFGVEFAGALPTPALALRCVTAGLAGVMVTGSHIPFDRNGIKFYLPSGEILKADEEAISGTLIEPNALKVPDSPPLPLESAVAREAYAHRYRECFGATALKGLRVGLYEHSAVGRDLTGAILEALGAAVIRLGRSDAFVPVDTEAVGEADLAQARGWCAVHRLDALVSTDGDGDRPVVFDERGEFVRGDLLGLLCAEALGIEAIAVPVSCNTALEASGAFARVVRTRIGSPYVIAGMHALAAEGYTRVAGFEANGGFLLGSALPGLAALPTRDALLPMIAVLAKAVQSGRPVSALLAALPASFTHSDRIQGIPSAASFALLARLSDDAPARDRFYACAVSRFDTTDGLRATLENGEIVHLRPSGNAPELRCYAEAGSPQRAAQLVESYLERAKAAIPA